MSKKLFSVLIGLLASFACASPVFSAGGGDLQHAEVNIRDTQSIQRGARRTHVDVRFKSGKEQTWVLEFAELERVDFEDVGD